MPISSQSNIKVENIWDLLGSFYTNLDPDDKTNVEALWEGLVGGGDALFFNMAQSYLSQYLDISQGYLDLGLWYIWRVCCSAIKNSLSFIIRI